MKTKSLLLGFVVGVTSVLIVLMVLVFTVDNFKTIAKYGLYYNQVTNMYDGTFEQSKMDESVYSGITSGLGDEHSVYIPKQNSDQFSQLLNTSNDGIGVMITSNPESGEVMITQVFDGSGAQKANLFAGDKIIEVNGVKIDKSNVENIVTMIKENPETKLVINRPSTNETLSIDVQNGPYDRPSITSNILQFEEKNYGYIDIDSFSDTTASEFEEALIKLEESNINGLIIDVRDNGGGYLTAVNEIADQIVTSDRPYLYVKKKDKVDAFYTSKLKEPKSYKIVGLQNENSASASEILMGALKEVNGNDVVGTKSYGKGSVQTTIPMRNGGITKLTVDHWFTADNNTIEKTGITPTIEINEEINNYIVPIVLEKKLAQGDNHDIVQQINYYLYLLGYDVDRESKEFNSKTSEAVRNFQSDNNLDVTGVVDIYTADQIFKNASDITKIFMRDPYIIKSLEVMK